MTDSQAHAAARTDQSEVIGRREAMKKGAVGAAVAGAVWAAPKVQGMTLRPNYAAAQSGLPPTFGPVNWAFSNITGSPDNPNFSSGSPTDLAPVASCSDGSSMVVQGQWDQLGGANSNSFSWTITAPPGAVITAANGTYTSDFGSGSWNPIVGIGTNQVVLSGGELSGLSALAVGEVTISGTCP